MADKTEKDIDEVRMHFWWFRGIRTDASWILVEISYHLVLYLAVRYAAWLPTDFKRKS